VIRQRVLVIERLTASSSLKQRRLHAVTPDVPASVPRLGGSVKERFMPPETGLQWPFFLDAAKQLYREISG
jgi:hypothetical protein